MTIIDLSAGGRSVWFNKFHPSVVYVDRREECRPTVVCDTRELPFPDGVFDLVVFDPPHVTHGEGSTMAKYYSAMTAEEIRDLVRRTAVEAYRVTPPWGLMTFKWNDHDVKLQRILELMEGWEPLFGHQVATRTSHRSSTYWCLLRKRASLDSPEGVYRFLRENEAR